MAHEVTLADSDGPIARATLEELIATVGRLALWHFRHCEEAVLEEFRQAFLAEQATVEDTRARLEDRLPQILAELKPVRGSRLRDALNRYETKEQSIPPNRRADQLPAAKRLLWEEVASPETATELLALIRQGIGSYPHHGDLPPDPIRRRYSIGTRGADETLIVATQDLAGKQRDHRDALRQLVLDCLPRDDRSEAAPHKEEAFFHSI